MDRQEWVGISDADTGEEPAEHSRGDARHHGEGDAEAGYVVEVRAAAEHEQGFGQPPAVRTPMGKLTIGGWNPPSHFCQRGPVPGPCSLRSALLGRGLIRSLVLWHLLGRDSAQRRLGGGSETHKLRGVQLGVAGELGPAPVAAEVDTAALVVGKDLRIDPLIGRDGAMRPRGRFGIGLVTAGLAARECYGGGNDHGAHAATMQVLWITAHSLVGCLRMPGQPALASAGRWMSSAAVRLRVVVVLVGRGVGMLLVTLAPHRRSR